MKKPVVDHELRIGCSPALRRVRKCLNYRRMTARHMLLPGTNAMPVIVEKLPEYVR